MEKKKLDSMCHVGVVTCTDSERKTGGWLATCEIAWLKGKSGLIQGEGLNSVTNPPGRFLYVLCVCTKVQVVRPFGKLSPLRYCTDGMD